jgi:hypothetical protein
MATTTTNFGWDIPQSTDLVKDGATAIAALGQDIDTALVDLKGGTTGQVLAKASNTDLDFSWVAQDDSNAIQNAIVDAKGDLIGATAADTPARLAVGTNGQVLTADSAESTGLKWVTPAPGGGKVAQVVQTVKTDTFTSTSTSFTDITGLSVSITPTSASSTILVSYSVVGASTAATSDSIASIRLMRGSTAIGVGDSAGSRKQATGSISTRETSATTINFTAAGDFIDSPATTSATTYKIQGVTGAGTFFINRTQGDADAGSSYRTISTITVMEILA